MPRKDDVMTFGEAIQQIGFKDAARALGRKGGKATSAAKARAARANGKKGGRPLKPK